MFEVSITRSIAAPPERVFAVFSDLEDAAQRIQAIERLELLTPPPVGVGTRFRETRTMFGKRATEEMTITAFDPPRGYDVEAQSHGSKYFTTFRFEPEPGGTRVSMHFEAQPLSTVAKLLSPLGKLMLGKLEKECGKDLDDLKRHLEHSI